MNKDHAPLSRKEEEEKAAAEQQKSSGLLSAKTNSAYGNWMNKYTPGGTGSMFKKKSKVSQPGDASEIQADAVANEFIQNKGSLTTNPASGNLPEISKSEANTASEPVDEVLGVVETELTKGQPLDENVKAELEEFTSVDLSGVKIHDDSGADSLNDLLGAYAFTYGQDIFFRAGEYDTESDEGKKLIAHEITHTIQNKASDNPEIKRDEDPLENLYNTYFEGEKDDFDISKDGLPSAIFISGVRPDLLFVPFHFTYSDIAAYLFDNKDSMNFEFEDSEDSATHSKEYLYRTIRVKDYSKLSNASYSSVRKFMDEHIEFKKESIATNYNSYSSRTLSNMLLRYAQCSEIYNSIGESYLDVLIGYWISKGILVKILDEMGIYEKGQVQKAFSLRSKKYGKLKELQYENADEFYFDPESKHHVGRNPLVVGRLYYTDTVNFLGIESSSLASYQIIGTFLIDSGPNRELVEINTRNEPGKVNVAKVVVPVNYDDSTIYYGMFVNVGQQDYVFKEEDYYDIAPKGKFYWYYPGTTLLPPDSFRDDTSAGSAEGIRLKRSLLSIGLERAKRGDYERLFALDYDVLELLKTEDSFTAYLDYDDPAYMYDDRTDYQREEANVELLTTAVSYGILGGMSSAVSGKAAGFLARVISLIPDSKASILVEKLKQNNLYQSLIAISHNISSDGVPNALALGRVLTQKFWIGQTLNDTKYDDKVQFKLGKDKESKYFFVKLEYAPMPDNPAIQGMVFKQIHDQSFSSQKEVNRNSTPISPFTILLVETVNEDGSTNVQLMSAIELAFIAQVITENLENEQLLGEIFTVIDIVLIVASLVMPVIGFWRVIGSFGLHYLIRYGARAALRVMIQRMLLKTGIKIVSRLFLEFLLAGIAIYRDEIEKLDGGKEFMAFYDVFMISLVAYDMRKFFASGVLAPMLLKGRQVLNSLQGVNNVLAGKMTNLLNHLEAWAAARTRWASMHMATSPELVAKLDNGTVSLSREHQMSFDAIYLEERARITQNSVLSALGKSASEMPDLVRVIENLKKIEAKTEITQKVIRKSYAQLERLKGADLTDYVSGLDKLLLNSTRGIEHKLPFMLIAASDKASVLTFGRANFLNMANKFLDLPPGYYHIDSMHMLADKMGNGSLPKEVCEWMHFKFMGAKDDMQQIYSFMLKDNNTSWIEFRALSIKAATGDKNSIKRLNSKFRAVVGEFLVGENKFLTLNNKKYNITGRQVKTTGGSELDFLGEEIDESDGLFTEILDDQNVTRLFEVKAWTPSYWEKAIQKYNTTKDGPIVRLLKQLNDAHIDSKSNPILVLTDELKKNKNNDIWDDLVELLRKESNNNGFETEFATFSEKEMGEQTKIMRKNFGL